MNSKENSDILADHVKKAEENGINATPTIYINDRKIEGVYPQEVFDAIINVELKKNDQ
jgi:protein-disulfide isomerase